jgi:adenine-specific DNA-methyltransferase
MFSINYIGSKYKLYNSLLNKYFRKYITADTIVGDLFGGTGIVGYKLASEFNCNVISNDIQYYSYVLSRASLEIYTKKEITLINRKITEYNHLQVKNGFIKQNYSAPKRLFFTTENGGKIDAIRIKLKEDKKILPVNVYFYLLASLISAADKIANTSCVYGAYLKKIKKSAQKQIELQSVETIPTLSKPGLCYNKNIMDISDKFDVVYLDPPYNHRQYCTNYHLLETIALYDSPKIYGKTGLRPYQDQKSDFCMKTKALDSFKKLIKKLNASVIMMSYNDEGILSKEEITSIFKKYGNVKIIKKQIKKFKAQNNVKRSKVYEYLFILEKR